jgi:hypothetical protein
MKKIILYSGVIGFITLQGCGNENKNNSESVETPVEQTSTGSDVVSTDSTQATISTQPGQTAVPVEQTISAPSAAPVTAPAATSTATGMNPAHGEPGHRCDISVGAPLNSPPGKNAPAAPTMITTDPGNPAVTAQPMQTQPVQAQPSAAPTVKVPTPPGMNPPHGEPGHDCAIAVGAPLKK